MKCYDFDKTIYKKDSSVSFFIFCLKKWPMFIFHFIGCLFLAIVYALGLIKAKRFKEIFFKFLNKIDNIDAIVEEFWEKEYKNINHWYLENMQESDVICSASPEFLVKPLFAKINSNAHVICTKLEKVDEKYKIVGANLKGEAKVEAIKKHFDNDNVVFDEVYTDSMSDLPILDLTENKFIVGKKGNVYKFGEQKPSFWVKIKYFFKLLRVKHYVKNALIFLPLFFSAQLINLHEFLLVLSGFVSFCLIASSIYVVNDLFDVKKDRLHYKKRKRPIACYMIKPCEAIILAIILFTLSIALSVLTFGFNIFILLILAGYVVLNILYSTCLKHVPIVDVFVLAICYLVRVFYGGLLINVLVSKWLFLTILCGSLFMGYGKRRGEINLEKAQTRKVNKFYNYNFLDKNMYTAQTMCLIFYSLWAIDFRGDIALGLINKFILLATIPLVYFIMMKYSLNIENPKNDGNPIDVFFKDKILILASVAFVALIVISVYVPINISI